MLSILAGFAFALSISPGPRSVHPAIRVAAAATAGPVEGVDAARRVVATLQLAAQEYRLAFTGSQLTHPSEAREAADFIAVARSAVRGLPAALAAEMEGRVAALALLVEQGGSPDALAAGASEVERRLTLAFGSALDERPGREPSLASGQRIFETRCAACHGPLGLGNGPAGRGLTPPPANLTDTALTLHATPVDLYRKITHGVPGTAMAAWESTLTREERWDAVAYVLALSDSSARRGGAGARGGQIAVVFGTVRGSLGAARDLAARGDREAAATKVLDAYMAYEAVEGALNATDPGVVKTAEQRFQAMRAAAAGGDAPRLAAAHAELAVSLAESERALTRGHTGAGLFAESFLLILREGFEAILVIGAIMAVLIKGGATAQRRHVRWGVALAVVASLVTAAVFEELLAVTPAQREALEGGVMLVAAATLFYVSYWLISKVEVAAWQRFVKGRIEKAVASGSALALAGAAFLAVYREGFETVLFYKALFIAGAQSAAAGSAPVVGGLLAGGAVLVVVYFAIEKFGLRIPVRPFFAVTSATLLYMCFTFAGTGIKELQEGAYLPATPIAGGPRNDLLGIYPTVESLAAQALILLAIAVALVWTFVIRPRRERSGGGDDTGRRPRTTEPRQLRKSERV